MLLALMQSCAEKPSDTALSSNNIAVSTSDTSTIDNFRLQPTPTLELNKASKDSLESLLARDFHSKWNYVLMVDTFSMTIVAHLPALKGGGTCSITIGKLSNGSLVRVLDAGNNPKDFNEGQRIAVLFPPPNAKGYVDPRIIVNSSSKPVSASEYMYDVKVKTTYLGSLK